MRINKNSRQALFFVVILALFIFPVCRPAFAASKKVKVSGFSMNRTNADSKAAAVKVGKNKLNVKKGFIKFVAPSRGIYSFSIPWPPRGRHLNITPLFPLGTNLMTCDAEKIEFAKISGGWKNYLYYGNIQWLVGDEDEITYKAIKNTSNRYGGKVLKDLLLEKGECVYFYLSFRPNRKTGLTVKISRKDASPEKSRPAFGSVWDNYRSLKEIIAEKGTRSADGTRVFITRWTTNGTVNHELRISYNENKEEFVIKYIRPDFTITIPISKTAVQSGEIHPRLTMNGKFDISAGIDMYTFSQLKVDMGVTIHSNSSNDPLQVLNAEMKEWIEITLWQLDSHALEKEGLSTKKLGFVSYM